MNQQHKFKVLVNKQTGLFGVLHQNEIWDSSCPILLGESITMDLLKKYVSDKALLNDPNELDSYYLCDVELVTK